MSFLPKNCSKKKKQFLIFLKPVVDYNSGKIVEYSMCSNQFYSCPNLEMLIERVLALNPELKELQYSESSSSF